MIKSEHLRKHISNKSEQNANLYVGRFAPSPSGPMHFGSLVCALASFLHAKQHQGKWLVRIEDVDTPRVESGMAASILTSLQAHGLMWDNEVVYQSQRFELYEAYLAKLEKSKQLYGCLCSRQQIKLRSDSYDGFCRDLALPYENAAIRFAHDTNNRRFVDLFRGQCTIKHSMAKEDPVLRRADGIYAYHLAVVADDIEQKITHIVRGNDLLDTTPVHLSLFQALRSPPPHYLHIPIVVQKTNEKLSKQHHSPAIKNDDALENLKLALQYLGISPQKLPEINNIVQLIDWAVGNWSLKLLPKQSELLISVANGVYLSSKNMLDFGRTK